MSSLRGLKLFRSVDKSMLGDTEFDNLLFLWYDEENENNTMYQQIIAQMLL